MKRILFSIKRNGLIGSLKKIFSKIKYRLFKNVIIKKNAKKLDELFINNNWDKIIIYENNFGWESIMKQRPQQIASNFNDNILFIYSSSHDEYSDNSRIKKLKDNLYLIDLNIYRNIIINILKNINNKFAMFYSTDYIQYEIVESYINNNFKILYEYVDDIDENLCGAETAKLLIDRHSKIINDKNTYIITTASKLYNNVINTNKNAKVKLVTNGVDYNHFFKNPNMVPNDLEEFVNSKKKIIGYYGALASWFDYDLIKKLSENKNYQIILLGNDYDGTLNKSGILNIDNISYLGKKKYEDLPSYSYNFDVCIIPFIINDITLSTSPVKVFEYMAVGKPIVTTDLPECRKYKSILTSKTKEEFVKNIEKALLKKTDKDYLSLLHKEALENTWKNKCEEIVKFISNSRRTK